MGLRVTALVPAPNVAGVSVRGPIAVILDGPIDPASIDGAIHLTPPVSGKMEVRTLPDDRQPSVSASPSAVAPATSAADVGNNVLVFTPDAPLASHTTYTVSMSSSVRRTDGEAATGQSWTFTTGEPPTSAQNQIVFLSDRGGVANVWLMNPDGSNQREVTAELVPVNGFDVRGDGNAIAYGAGGLVKWMGVNGDNLHELTASGSFDYAPEFTPNGTGLVVARRDATGADKGYWLMPIVSGADPRQLAPDGAPGLGSVAVHGDELTGSPGEPLWAPRAAFSADGKTMLVVRGSDNAVALVDVAGIQPPAVLGLEGNSRPIWDPQGNAFYIAASPDGGVTWSYFEVTTGGLVTRIGEAVGDLTISVNGRLAFTVRAADGAIHLAAGSSANPRVSQLLTTDPAWSEGSPSFSPDGSLIVFGRFGTRSPTVSGGIWIIAPDGTSLTNLATDGAYPRWLP
jgi:WD40 repeat protein